ncbi:MAG TPA: protein phosphatase 2C domain-containing protein [Abditibacteriaceae bacterium]|nr:protein phosphatase 2C domain-containing protein [Abditibacteriaceae bacterium]
MKDWQFAAGSVQGRHHRTTGRNNQDALCWMRDGDNTVAVVCDGCGSGEHSEVGAQIGARIVTQALIRALNESDLDEDNANQDVADVLEKARGEILDRVLDLAQAMGDNLTQTLCEYFLFTIVGVCITRRQAVYFSLGDGLIFVNGEKISLGPFPNNAPPYLAYGLMTTSLAQNCPQILRFQINRVLPMEELQSFLIGTDGVQDLVDAADKMLPGKEQLVGSINALWKQDRFFANPDAVRRHLAGVNRDFASRDSVHSMRRVLNGLLFDDTTLIVARRPIEYSKDEEGGEK